MQLEEARSGQFKCGVSKKIDRFIAAIKDRERGRVEQKHGMRKIAEQVAINAARRLCSRARTGAIFLM
jgi:hypothetical protein